MANISQSKSAAAKRAAFHNLGCKVNSYELDMIRQEFLDNGFTEADFDEAADVYIVNTCTVTGIAGKKSRQMLRRARRTNPDAVVIAVGCYVETEPEALEDGIADLLIGSRQKLKTFEIYSEYLKGKTQPAAEERSPFPEHGKVLSRPERTRADIKVQDGCDRFCTYCIIPYARGRITSRPAEDVTAELAALSAAGIKEAVLSGIHIGSYGADLGQDPRRALTDLIRACAAVDGIDRVRIGSIEPVFADRETVRELSGIKELCPHFHLSLQSGCDKTLRRMNRRYTAAEYKESVGFLREYFDRPALTTDVIVGFPGETDEDFEESLSFVEETGFYMVHVFKYSKRKGTPAASYPDQVPEEVKNKRSDILLDLTAGQAKRYREQFAGEEAVIYPEQIFTAGGRAYCTGHTERYLEVCAPLSGDAELSGELPDVMTGRLVLPAGTILDDLREADAGGMLLLERDA
ncbi:MAG: tRNA (N(6)-L-threonylcarbamoyladenosine(37)-C(2))-methylthiotransferase MtaB [Lachnospiraceae bacterium]|nr:tRNA (N(6)-L-threonylcarbamoyladenosine(37)-C(2))-methylthiotransferase MtaB [Lachnospiraceae bacterium]